jgi:Xaa-Pro aminopeptidase
MNLELPGQAIQENSSDRRIDVDAKQLRMSELLASVGCEGLLILDQANLAWLTAGGVARNVLDPAELPALWYTPSQRWLIASNVDSQRMFDEEVDQLGFLLKEWPWHWHREQVLADLCAGRRMASDLPFLGAKLVDQQLRQMRRALSRYERACLFLLGEQLVHAVEATCRNAQPGETERELAGQVSHRLLRKGAVPIALSVTADGRASTYRRHGFTSAPIEKNATITATARKYGLHATCSRTFTFGPAEDALKREALAACRVQAMYIAGTWPDAVPRELLNSGRRVCQLQGYEHDWELAGQGFVTGRLPVERTLGPDCIEPLGLHWPITWTASVGAGACADTYVVGEQGPGLTTRADNWPIARIRVTGTEIDCPTILERLPELPKPPGESSTLADQTT